MVNSLPFTVLVGTGLGFLSGLGVGGGSLLLLWLTLVLELPQNVARTINLMFFIPSAIASSLLRWRQAKLRIANILPAALAGACGALLCAWGSTKIDTELMRKLFGALLLFTGVRELMYKPRKS